MRVVSVAGRALRQVAFAAPFVLCLTPAALAESTPGADCSLVGAAMETAASVRGLKSLRSVPCRLQNRKQVEDYLRDIIRTKIPKERITNEGIVYQVLGIIPPDFKYEEGLIDLYTSQLGGYYDAERDFYAMADWMPEMMQYPIAVHELTHALQDQHFHLDHLLDQKSETSDALIARSALVEGDATAVMLDYSRKLIGQPSLAAEKSVSGLMMQNIAGAMLSSSLTTAPPGLQSILVFPYVSGLNFVHALLRDGGYRRVDRAFSKLPSSSEEILHPQKYFSANRDYVEIAHIDISPLAGQPIGEPVFTDRIGEFVISTMLSSFIPPGEASEAANGWGGDRIELYRLEGGKHVLYWDLRWDTEKDAEHFFKAGREAFRRRFKESAGDSVSVAFDQTPFGKMKLTREGQRVVLLVLP